MQDSNQIVKRAYQYIAEVIWCSELLRKNTVAGSKAVLMAELLYRYAVETRGTIDLISHEMGLEEFENMILH